MATYDKPKRKNAPVPQIPIWQTISWLLSGLFNYGLVAPIRWTWRTIGNVINWSLRQTGAILIWSWRATNFILRNTVFVPFIFVGRLLGFVANAVPKGLSPREVEAYQRINRQFRRQKRWYLHILIFLMSMATLWITELSSPYYPHFGMAITMTVVWLLALGGHRFWMHLGESEDREIGNALHQIRQSQRAVYYEEEEIYEEQPYDSSRLEEVEYIYEWDEDEEHQQAFKSKRQSD